MSVLDRFWKRDELIQRTIEIESSIYDDLEYLSETVYDASISKIVNACIDYLLETEDVKLYPKDDNELYTKHSLIFRKNSLDGLEKLKEKYGISVYKLINISVKNVLKELENENLI